MTRESGNIPSEHHACVTLTDRYTRGMSGGLSSSGVSRGASPARWAAAGAIGGGSLVGMLWATIGRAPAPLTPVLPPPAMVEQTSPVLVAPAIEAGSTAPVEPSRSLPARESDPAADETLRGEVAAAPSPAGPLPAEPTPSVVRPERAAEPAAERDSGPTVAVERLNINTATRAELELLPRIGPTLAQRIIEFREAEGGIRSLTHLTDVKGIGVRTAEQLEPYIRFD